MVKPERVAELRMGAFDQAPVVDDGRGFIGVVDTTVADQLLRDGAPLTAECALIERARLPAECSVQDLLVSLARSNGVLVHDDDRDAWLVTLSDLNRHRFRSVLYSTFAELEALLARLIDVTHPDPWVWLSLLREDVQARLVGYWEISNRRGVGIGPQAAATLTELLAAVSASADLRGPLGYASRKMFDRETGGFPDYRNRVMHPARPLLLSRDEVSDLRSALERIDRLVERSRDQLAQRGYGSRVAWL